jgi:hypothetical protein
MNLSDDKVMMDFGWPGFAIAHEPEVKLPTSVQAI